MKGKNILKKLIVFALIGILFSVFFGMGGTKVSGTTIGPIDPSDEMDWNGKGNYKFNHRFAFESDSLLVDVAQITKDGQDKGYAPTVEYEKRGDISYWKFFNSYETYKSKEDRVILSQRTYSLYQMKGFANYFLILDERAQQVAGIYKKTTTQNCSKESGANITCPWKYYLVNATLYETMESKKIYQDGQYINVSFSFDDVYSKICPDVGINLYDYMSSAAYSSTGAPTADTCIKGGVNSTAADYWSCFFPKGGKFENVVIKDNGNSPPTIYIPPKTFDDSDDVDKPYYKYKRPPLTFTLNYVLSSTGVSQQNNVYFYFIATNYSNLAIRIQDCTNKNPFVTIGTKESLDDDDIVSNISSTGGDVLGGSRPDIYFTESSMKIFADKVYESGSGYPECKVANLDDSNDGQLKKWGIEIIERDESAKYGTGDSQCEKDAQCRNILSWMNLRGAMCRIGCMVYEIVGEFINWALDWLNTAAGISQNFFAPQKAYAMTPLSKSLDANQIQTAWKFSLAITDIIVIFALMLVAFANILKINIDVYAVKKSLFPLLIGVILAHLSLLISKVIIDFASLLSQYFVDKAAGWGQGPMEGIVSASGSSASNIGDKLAALMGISPTATGTVVSVTTLLGLVGIATGGLLVGCALIVLPLIVLFIPGILIFALAFLMYARIYVVYVLVILAPLAFVCLGFPPLQQYFKQWWGWFIKWVFLAPIAYFLIALAAIMGGVRNEVVPPPERLSLAAGWFLGVIILAMAIMVPFKLGGAIMSAWGRFGQMITGTGKGGFMRKAAGFAAGSAAIGALTTRGGQPSRLGKVVGRITEGWQARQAGQETGWETVTGEAKQKRLKAIEQKRARGEKLNPQEMGYWRKTQDEFRQTGASYMNESPETLMSYLGKNKDEQRKTAADWANGTLQGSDVGRINAVMYGIQNNRRWLGLSDDERQKQQGDIEEQLGQKILGGVGASGPAAAATPAETVAVKGTGDRGTEIAQLQRINNNLESYLQKGNNQKNLPTQIESLERLNNHLTGGGTWDNAPDELKTSFINMRGDIKPEKLKPSDLQKEITGTIKVANLVVKENFNLAHARATLISDLQRSLRTGAPIEISPQTSRHITNTVHLINIRRQININPATTIDSLSSGLRGLTGVQLRGKINEIANNTNFLKSHIEGMPPGG